MSDLQKIGTQAPEFRYATPWKNNLQFQQVLHGKKGYLVFLRYYGCSLCQLQLMKYIKHYERFRKANVELFVVLQSEPETIREQVDEDKIPFTIICDPNQELFALYGVRAASSEAELKNIEPGKWQNFLDEVQANGITHGKYEGNELQLPAVFLIDETNRISFLHYGLNGADIPEIEELLTIASSVLN